MYKKKIQKKKKNISLLIVMFSFIIFLIFRKLFEQMVILVWRPKKVKHCIKLKYFFSVNF